MAEMSPLEWAEWQLYDERHPLDTKRFDYLFAMLAKTIADFSQVLNRERYPNGIPLDEFMPEWGASAAVELTVEQSTAWVVGLAEMLGATDLRGVKRAG